MSDELDFFSDPTPAADPAPSAEPTPAPSGPSMEEFNALKTELDNAKRFQQDFQRFAAQTSGQPQAPQDRFQRFIQDPDGYENEILSKAANMARTEYQEAQAIAKVESEFPELAPMKTLIDWGALMQITAPQFKQKHGRVPSLEEALRESASYLKTQLQGQTGSPQQTAQREVMRLNAGGAQPPAPQGLDGINLDALSKEDFYKLQAQLQAKHYQ